MVERHTCNMDVPSSNLGGGSLMLKKKENKYCQHCNKVLTRRFKIRFCSNKCQLRHRHESFISDWKKGIIDGGIGIHCKTISHYIRRYLAEKYEGKCSLCGWDKKNPITNKVPLEIDHIDGNAANNLEENLRLICPNCHSLTPHFRNLNKGKGRSWRLSKYHAGETEKRNEIYFVSLPQNMPQRRFRA